MSVPVKLTPLRQSAVSSEQVLSWQFRHQALADGELEFLEGRWLHSCSCDIDLKMVYHG